MSITEEQVRYWVRDELRKIIEKGLMYSAETKPKPQPKPQPKPETIPTVQILMSNFPSVLQPLLTAEEEANIWFLKPIEYIRKPEKWQSINNIVKNLGGKWISMKADSHWEVPK